MVLGERILERMAQLQLTQSELARRVGLKQPTINNLIYRSKRGSTHLHKIARELGTTPAYLLGETDDPKADGPDNRLTSEEQRFLEIYRQLPKKDRAAMKLLLERMATESPTAD